MSRPEVIYNSFLIDFLIAPKYRIGRHVLLVLFFVFVSFNMPYIICSEYLDKIDNMVLYAGLFLLVAYLTGLYLHMYVLLPKLLLKNKYQLYIGSISLLILLILAISFGVDYWINNYYEQKPGHYSFFYENRIMAVEIIGNFFLFALLIAGTSLTVLLRQWLQFSMRKNELEKVNLKTELERLKDQINPEFLFSMLDEAGEQTVGNPEQASKVLMKLSKLLRYQLYDGNREKVLLISEISFIENFLILAQMRYTNLSFALTWEGNVNRKLVPPLLFIPFAICYVKLLTEKTMQMDLQIFFRVEEAGLLFSCICFSPGISLADIENSRELTDVKHRFDLLFAGSYTLTMVGDGPLYKTNLYIKL